MDLLTDPPANPDISKGYLDLLKDVPDTNAAPPRNTGAIQRFWASGPGSMFYDNTEAIGRKLMSSFQLPNDWLNIPSGGIALDVGSGPGSVTATLARRGPDGLAWVSTSPNRCWPVPSAPKRGRMSASCARMPNSFHCATRRGRGRLRRGAAADTEPGGDPGRDGQGAAARWSDGRFGAHAGTRLIAVAPASQRWSPHLRRRRTRRHPRGPRTCRRALEEHRQHPMVRARRL